MEFLCKKESLTREDLPRKKREVMDGEKPPDEKMAIFDTKKWPDKETNDGGGKKPPDDPANTNEWPGTEEVPSEPSWAQIIGGQVADDEVRRFEKEFELMVPGEGAVAKMTGSDYVLREKYLEDLAKIIKENEEEKATMRVLHFRVEEVDEEGNKINYTEGETNEMLAAKDEAAMRLTVAMFNSKWMTPFEGLDSQVLGDSFYIELGHSVKICKILKTELDGNETDTTVMSELNGKKWKLTLEDTRIFKRISAMKRATVLIKDVLNKVDIRKLNGWMENFGEIHSIKPKVSKCQHEDKFREDETIPAKEKKSLLEWCRNKAKRGPDVEVIMDLKVSVPMILPINNWKIEVSHEDQVPQCQNCYRIGHYTSRCLNKRTQFKTYSSFANSKWGSVEEILKINDQRNIDTIRHKLTVTRLMNRGVKPENIKSNRSIDQSTSKAIIRKVKEDIEQRYKIRSKVHAKSEFSIE